MTLNKPNSKKILKWVGWLLSGLAIAFLVYKIISLDIDFSLVDNIPLFVLFVITGILSKMISVVAAAGAWGEWLPFLSNRKVRFADLFNIYGRSNIGKYIPGNVMHYVERNLFAAEIGLDQKKVAFSSLINVIQLVLAAVILSLLLSPGTFTEIIKMSGIFSSGVRVFLVISAIAVLAVILFLLLKKKKMGEIIVEYSRGAFLKTFILTLLLCMVSLVFLGIVLAILYGYCVGAMPEGAVLRLLIAGYSVAWVAGFILPGASGGLGVREAVLTMMLENVVGGEIIIFIAIVHRLITIAGDFLIYLFVVINGAKRK